MLLLMKCWQILLLLCGKKWKWSSLCQIEYIELMTARGLTKIQFAKALGKKPSEITKWLSGQHNFTLKTISMLSVFFGEPLIKID